MVHHPLKFVIDTHTIAIVLRQFFNLASDLAVEFIVRWTLVKLQGQDPLDYFTEWCWHLPEELTHITNVNSLS